MKTKSPPVPPVPSVHAAVAAYDGAVVVATPDGRGIVLTPDAALELSEFLLYAGVTAKGYSPSVAAAQ